MARLGTRFAIERAEIGNSREGEDMRFIYFFGLMMLLTSILFFGAVAQAGKNQECWSKRKCTGKILNHKDAHNCKLSGGKSWWSDQTRQCTNL
jgi:hypothetical protein